MRIEHQGYVEVQPPYQHVGYTSASLTSALRGGSTTGFAAFTVLLPLVLALALRVRNRFGYAAGTVVLVAAMGTFAGWGSLLVLQASDDSVGREMSEVLSDLERACLATEAWAAEHGRLPTVQEWTREWPPSGQRRTLEYRMRAYPGADGQKYLILSRPAAQDSKGPDTEIRSEWFGPDGLHSTPDDDRALTELIREWGLRGGRTHHARPARK